MAGNDAQRGDEFLGQAAVGDDLEHVARRVVELDVALVGVQQQHGRVQDFVQVGDQGRRYGATPVEVALGLAFSRLLCCGKHFGVSVQEIRRLFCPGRRPKGRVLTFCPGGWSKLQG